MGRLLLAGAQFKAGQEVFGLDDDAGVVDTRVHACFLRDHPSNISCLTHDVLAVIVRTMLADDDQVTLTFDGTLALNVEEVLVGAGVDADDFALGLKVVCRCADVLRDLLGVRLAGGQATQQCSECNDGGNGLHTFVFHHATIRTLSPG